MHIKRTVSEIVKKNSQNFPVLLITGPRQVGKTTCLQHAASEDRKYVTLDDPQARTLANDDPGLFLQRFPAPVLIDEIQYAPELLPLIKIAVDTHRKNGDFWLTGSQQFNLMQNVSESLAGRVGILQLLGFSFREINNQAGRVAPFSPETEQEPDTSPVPLMQLYERIWRGSFPAITIDQTMDRDLFYSSYLQTYLQRDVKELTNIGDEIAFTKFLRAAAGRSGQLLNMADMSRDAGVSPNTAKSWLSVLRASGLIYLLEPYHSNLTKRMVKSPKLYFLDTGLASYLTEWTSYQTLEAGAMSGAIFETWVFTEILKSYLHAGKTPPLYYYRDRDQKEIDLLIVQDGQINPIEIKKATAPTKNDVRHFSTLQKLNLPVGKGVVVCMTDRTMPITDTVQAVPASTL